MNTIPWYPEKENVIPLTDIVISDEKIEEMLKKLSPSKSSGPDDFHPRVLSELYSVISRPLSILMRKSLDEGVLPQTWKDACVSPIFKKGKKSQTTN